MKAAVFHEAGKPLSIERVADPQAGPRELVLKVSHCGICGTDLHAASGGSSMGLQPGTIMGHEFSGEVVAVGREVQGWRAGDQAVALPFIGCGACLECLAGHPFECAKGLTTGFALPGGYAEFVRVGARESLKLPAAMSTRDGALVEPMAVGLHALRKAHMPAGARVLVIGAGPIGLATLQWARVLGARHVAVSERMPARRALAERLGASAVLDGNMPNAEIAAAFAREAGGPPDMIFECVGVPGVIQAATEIAPRHATIVVVGFCDRMDNFLPAISVAKELVFRHVVAYGRDDFDITIDMMERNRVEPTAMITDVVDFTRLPQAFEALKTDKHQCKVLLKPGP